jgi:hypothetical protein
MKKNNLGNPAVATVLSNDNVTKSIASTVETKNEIAKSTVPFVVKTLFVLGLGYFVYYKIVNRFVSLKENSNYPTSNITNAQAVTRADSIFEAMNGLGSNLEIVKQNIAGLNYNGFIKVYNAFGSRQGSVPFSSKMTMIEWFNDQFNTSELEQLRFLVPNIF